MNFKPEGVTRTVTNKLTSATTRFNRYVLAPNRPDKGVAEAA